MANVSQARAVSEPLTRRRSLSRRKLIMKILAHTALVSLSIVFFLPLSMALEHVAKARTPDLCFSPCLDPRPSYF